MGDGAEMAREYFADQILEEIALEARLNSKHWYCRDGRVLEIASMETSHILNVINHQKTMRRFDKLPHALFDELLRRNI